MIDQDPPEFVGTEEKIVADPKGKRAAPPVAFVKPVAALVEELASPVAPVKPGGHPKHAIARPRREHEAAQQEVIAAQTELKLANDEVRETEIAEGNALSHWLSLQPTIDPDELLRDYANRQTEQRAANVAAGLPPEGVRAPSHGRSAVDIAAINRPRTNAQQPTGAPLRSPVARRVV